MTSIIDWAIKQQDRRAGADRSADVMQAVREVIAAEESIPPATRLELLRELDRRWKSAGLL
jgi:hypothetical protein